MMWVMRLLDKKNCHLLKIPLTDWMVEGLDQSPGHKYLSELAYDT